MIKYHQKGKFIEISHSDKHFLINIENVTNISYDKKTSRVTFHFNYLIDINNYKKADYKSFYFENEEKVNEFFDFLKYHYGHYFLIENKQRWVNLNNVSFISFDDERNRVIFNFNYSINQPKSSNVSSDFIYWNYRSELSYEQVKERLLMDISGF